MAGRVWLEVVAGPIQGRRFEFHGHDTFLFGRALDCHAGLPQDDTTASRHHFLLEVNPPAARLRDLGSLNGTWVNGVRFGGRVAGQAPDAGARGIDLDLKDGDHVRVGTTIFAVHVEGTGALTAPRLVDAPSPAAARVPLPAASPARRPLPVPSVPGYAVGRRIGRGGMGEVFLARREKDGREVALKLMRPEMGVDPEARAVFLREIDVSARLRHPHIVALLDHGSVGDSFYFAMEYCAGGNLSAALMKDHAPLPRETVVRVGLQLLDALEDAHARGFVHRDIKPENVLLTDATLATAKLADFGLAKSFQQAGLSGMTATGAVAGTPQFMPREQLTNFRLVRPSGDVWSLSATLYHALTLDFPRDFPFGAEPLQVILEGPIVPLRTRRPDLPPALGAVLDKGLCDDVAARWQDAGQMRAALAALH